MRRFVLAAVIAAVMATAGCTGSDDETDPGSGGGPSAAGSESPTPSGDPGGTPEPSPSGTPVEQPSAASLTFGESFTYDSGLAVTVGEPKEYTPSEDAVTGGEPDFVSFEVTVENGSDTEIAAGDVSATVQSGGGGGGDVIDPDGGATGSPTEAIAAGDEVTFTLAFGVSDPQDVTFQLLPGLDVDPVNYTR